MEQLRKFEEVLDASEYEVLSDIGFVSLKNVMKTIPYKKYMVFLDDGRILECADKHILIKSDGSEVYAMDSLYENVIVEDGTADVMSVIETDEEINMYDVEMDSHHKFYTNGILSHNTTTVGGYILHNMIFNKKFNIAILANKAPSAREVLDRVKEMYEELPWWLQQGVTIWNKGDIKLGNGTKVFTSATKGSGIRGKSVNCMAGSELITVKNKETGEIETLTFEELMERENGTS